jgi:hypothetical protein
VRLINIVAIYLLLALRAVSVLAVTVAACDYVVELPETIRGNRHLLVFVDVFSRWAEVVAVPDLEMSTFVRAFIDVWISRHGCPRRLVSDRGGQFIGDLARGVYRALSIRKSTTTAYHPMANGLCERFNGTLVEGLKVLGGRRQDDWDDVLPKFLFAYNTSVHSATRFSPFEMEHGRVARTPTNAALRQPGEGIVMLSRRQHLRTLKWDLAEMRQVVLERAERDFARRKEAYDKKGRKTPVGYVVGDRVWLYDPAVPKGLKGKLFSKWYGPFTIRRVCSAVTYELELPEGKRIHPVVHANRLHLCTARECPPTTEMDLGRESTADALLPYAHYVTQAERDGLPMVEEIVGERVRVTASGKRVVEFRCRYRGKTEDEAGWVPEKLVSAGDLVYRFRNAGRRFDRQCPVEEYTV